MQHEDPYPGPQRREAPGGRGGGGGGGGVNSDLNLHRCLSAKVMNMFSLKTDIKFGSPLRLDFCGTLFNLYGFPLNFFIHVCTPHDNFYNTFCNSVVLHQSNSGR